MPNSFFLSIINLDLILRRNVCVSKGKAVVVLLKQCIYGLALALVDYGWLWTA